VRLGARHLALPLIGLTCVVQAASPAAETTAIRWRCEVAYLPARSTWVRQVEFELRADGVHALRIDGLAPHAFTVSETALITAVDNERIVIDLDARQWQSNFRGLAQGQGRCDVWTD
jgi:hypothetical protein